MTAAVHYWKPDVYRTAECGVWAQAQGTRDPDDVTCPACRDTDPPIDAGHAAPPQSGGPAERNYSWTPQ